jgi:hypothetical protein
LNVEKGNIGLNSGMDSRQIVDQFATAVQQFRNVPSAAQYDTVSDLCGKLATVASKAIPGKIDGASCTSPAAFAMLGSAKPRLAAFQAFQTNCSAAALGAKNKVVATQEGADTFEAARQAVNDCLTNAEDTGLDVTDARADFDKFIAINSPNRDPTTRAIDGLLFRTGQVQAGMAYAFAIAQELLILALSFFAEWRRPKGSRALRRPDIAIRPEDSLQVAAAKLVLASRKPVKGVSRLFRVDASFPNQPDLDPAVKTNAQNHLMHLVEDEVARAGGLDDEFFLGPDALRRLENIIDANLAPPARAAEQQHIDQKMPQVAQLEWMPRKDEPRPPPAEASIRRRRRR